MKIKVNQQYNQLERIKELIETSNPVLKCSIQIDIWVEYIVKASVKCVVVQRSPNIGVKILLHPGAVAETETILPNHFLSRFRSGVLAAVIHLVSIRGQDSLLEEVNGYLKQIEEGNP